MFHLQVATKQDLKEAAVIEHRRRYEDQRKERIFNAKKRMIGIDVEAIENQLAEKQQHRQVEAETDRRFIVEEARINQIVQLKNDENKRDRFRLEADIIEYRKRFQRKEDAREFDLNDPNYIVNSVPTRIDDNDPRLTISSAQKFDGEDVQWDARKKLQIEQTRSWLQQQMREREQAKQDKLTADSALQAALNARDQRAQQLDRAESDTRHKMQVAIAEYNQYLAAEAKRKRELEKEQDQQDSMAEIFNCLTSDMLTENKEMAKSNLGDGRKISANYRGMTDEEIAQIHEDRLNQCAENEKRKLAVEDIDNQWVKLANTFDRMAVKQQREIDRKTKALQLEITNVNNRLAVEQKARHDTICSNQPTEEFYAKFNTTTR